MTIQKLREAHGARPFRPFIIHMADGREILVTHPEFMAVSPSGRTITVYQPDDSSSFVDLLLVTELEFRPNGQQRRPPRRRT